MCLCCLSLVHLFVDSVTSLKSEPSSPASSLFSKQTVMYVCSHARVRSTYIHTYTCLVIHTVHTWLYERYMWGSLIKLSMHWCCMANLALMLLGVCLCACVTLNFCSLWLSMFWSKYVWSLNNHSCLCGICFSAWSCRAESWTWWALRFTSSWAVMNCSQIYSSLLMVPYSLHQQDWFSKIYLLFILFTPQF